MLASEYAEPGSQAGKSSLELTSVSTYGCGSLAGSEEEPLETTSSLCPCTGVPWQLGLAGYLLCPCLFLSPVLIGRAQGCSSQGVGSEALLALKCLFSCSGLGDATQHMFWLEGQAEDRSGDGEGTVSKSSKASLLQDRGLVPGQNQDS